jgi:hypothetical protein
VSSAPGHTAFLHYTEKSEIIGAMKNIILNLKTMKIYILRKSCRSEDQRSQRGVGCFDLVGGDVSPMKVSD